MKDYVELIADKIKRGADVIFYTVGSCTFEYLRELKNRFDLLPVAVCDGDVKKQGRTYNGLYGVTVISPDEAFSGYSDAEWFIPSLDYRYQIIGYLTEKQGVSPERIINYTPVSKIRSCSSLQKALIYDRGGLLRFCWRDQCPQIEPDDNLNTKDLLILRNNLIALIKSGKTLEGEPCQGCPQIREEYYPKDTLSWSINYFCTSVCNYRCTYCTVANNPVAESNNGKHTLGEVIRAFEKGGLLSDEYGVILSTAGEPLIHQKRSEFYEAFDGAELVINTNGSIYDLDLLKLMNRKRVLLMISIDAGTRETYAQVKGIDAYERVRKNLKRYSQASIGLVALKYLFIPGVNDNEENVDGFVEFFIETGATFAVVSIDYYGVDKITESTREMIKRLKAKLSKKNVLCVPYTAGETVEYAEKIRKLLD